VSVCARARTWNARKCIVSYRLVHTLPIAISVLISFLFSPSRSLVHALSAFGRSPSASSLFSSPCRSVSRWHGYPPYQPSTLPSSPPPSFKSSITLVVHARDYTWDKPRMHWCCRQSDRKNFFNLIRLSGKKI